MKIKIEKLNKIEKIGLILGLLIVLGAGIAEYCTFPQHTLHKNYDLIHVGEDSSSAFKVTYNLLLETHLNLDKNIKEMENNLKSETFDLTMDDFKSEGKATDKQRREFK